MSWIRIAACACLLALALIHHRYSRRPLRRSGVSRHRSMSDEVMRGKDAARDASACPSAPSPSACAGSRCAVRGTEMVNLPYAVPEEKDAKGKQIYPSRTSL